MGSKVGDLLSASLPAADYRPTVTGLGKRRKLRCSGIRGGASSRKRFYSVIVSERVVPGTVVPVVESMRDLGVLVTILVNARLMPYQEPKKRAGAILRTFVARDVNLLMRAFVTCVRPIVEYNSFIWSPSTVCVIHV